jgi:phosphonate transport system substrate-binding protein
MPSTRARSYNRILHKRSGTIRMKQWLLTIFILLSLTLLAGCSRREAAAVISLSQLEPLPAEHQDDVKPLRVAIAAIISPQGTVDSYSLMLDYLSSHLNRPVELVQRRTYDEINQLIASGDVELGLICTGAYIQGQGTFGMQLLGVPQVYGELVYHSLFIVPATSRAQTLEDLRGSVFAFTDPMSNTGRLYPTAVLQQSGETPETFFERTFYTYSHDDAIRAVASGVADGAAVDSLVYAYAIEREPELAKRTRIIHTSPAFGMPPVVTGPLTRPQVAAELQAVLLDMNSNQAGRRALAAAGIDAFVTIDDAAYDSARRLMEALNE